MGSRCNPMSRFIVISLLYLFVEAIPNASAQENENRIHTLLAKEKHPQCVLASSQSVICYLASTRELYQLQVRENSLSSRLLISLPAGTPWSSMGMDFTGSAQLASWSLSAQEDGTGNIVIAWQYRRDDVNSINVLYLAPNGQVQHSVLKEFKKHDPFFDLTTFVVGPHFVQFFYTYSSEQYFSPFSDAGSIQKLWTLGWRDNKVVFDTQLSEKGKAHTTLYDASYRGDGKFDVAWTEQRIGSFLGPRKKLKIGTVSSDKGNPQLQESAAVSTSQWETEKNQLVYPIIVQSDKEDVTALAAIHYGKNGSIYKKLDSNGKVLGEFRIDGDKVSEFGYDSSTGLFRYVKGTLTHFLKPPSVIKAELHWTDFGSREWVERLEVPYGSIFPSQRATDCFRWLEPDRGNFILRNKCRQVADSKHQGKPKNQ